MSQHIHRSNGLEFIVTLFRLVLTTPLLLAQFLNQGNATTLEEDVLKRLRELGKKAERFSEELELHASTRGFGDTAETASNPFASVREFVAECANVLMASVILLFSGAKAQTCTRSRAS